MRAGLLSIAVLAGCAGSTEGGLSWPPDPASFDCRAAGAPERIDPVPVACTLDRTCAVPLVSGHRGAGGSLGVLAPEDTVRGVYAAIAYGVDFVETDPRPTADGYLVNNHDATVDRTTRGTGTVAEMTLDEVQALPMRTDDYPGQWDCARIPTLEEILTAARGRAHVLVDANKTNRVDLLVAAIEDTDTVPWAIFDTSSPDKIAAALAIDPDLHTMIRVDDEAGLDAQLAQFADHPPDIVEIDWTRRDLAATVIARGHKPLMDVFVQDAAAVVADNLDPYREVFADGVVIAQSDRPDLVLKVLQRPGSPAAR